MKFERIEMNREDINWKWEERRKRNGWGWLFEIMIEIDEYEYTEWKERVIWWTELIDW